VIKLTGGENVPGLGDLARDQGGSSSKLGGEAIPFLARKSSRGEVNVGYKRHCLLPRDQSAVGLPHGNTCDEDRGIRICDRL
jgi:hypothetical protein